MDTLSALNAVVTTMAALVCVGCSNAPQLASLSQAQTIRSGEIGRHNRGIVQSIDLIHLTAIEGDSNLSSQAAKTTDAYKFSILMEDRSYQTVVQTTHGDLRVGDRVQVVNGAVRRY